MKKINEKLIILILAFLQFVHIVDFMIMMPLGDQLMNIFKISPSQFSIVVSAYTISAGIASFLGAFLIDKYDRKRALLFTFIGFSIGTLFCGLGNGFYELTIARVVTGFFGGAIFSITMSIVSDIVPVERRSTAMGILMSAFSVASIAGVPLGLYVANKFNWQMPFFGLAGLCVLVIILCVIYIPPMKYHLENVQQKSNPFEIIIDFTKDRNQQISLLFMVILVFSQMMIIPFITPYMIRNVGYHQDQIPLFYLAGGALTFISSPLVGKLADKYGRKKIFWIAATISMLPLVVLTNLQPVHIAVAIFTMAIFFVLVSSRMIPAQSIMTSIVHPSKRGGFMSLSSSAQQISIGISAYIGGLIVHTDAQNRLVNYNYTGYIAVFFTILAMFIATKIKINEGK